MPPVPEDHRNRPVGNRRVARSSIERLDLLVGQVRHDPVPPADRPWTRRLRLRLFELVHPVHLAVDDGVNATVNYRRRNQPRRPISRSQPERTFGMPLRRSEASPETISTIAGVPTFGEGRGALSASEAHQA